MKVLNAQNEALNGRPVTDEMKDISKAIGAGLGALKKDEDSEKAETSEFETTDVTSEVETK